MKKIIALALALLMIASMAVTAFAAGLPLIDEEAEVETTVANPSAEKGDDQTYVKYGVAQTYTVTILADIEFYTGLEQTGTVTAANVKLAGNETLVISVASKTNAWEMVDANGISVNVPYAMYINDSATAAAGNDQGQLSQGKTSDVEVLAVNRPNANLGTTAVKGEVDLTFKTQGTAQEGSYLDLLTFTVAIATDRVEASATGNEILDNGNA